GGLQAGDSVVSNWCDGRVHQNLVLGENDFDDGDGGLLFSIRPSQDTTLCVDLTGGTATVQPCNTTSPWQAFLLAGSNLYNVASGCIRPANNSPTHVAAAINGGSCTGDQGQAFWPYGYPVQLQYGDSTSNLCLSIEGGGPELLACETTVQS